MLRDVDRRLLLAVGCCAIVQVAVVLAVAAKQPNAGAGAVVAAVLLAPVAVVAAAAAARRLAGGWFPLVAAAAVVLLPFLANRFLLARERADFDRHALPALVGTQATGVFALGVFAVVLVAVLPRTVAAAAGLAGVAAALAVWSPGALGDLKPMLHETAYSVALPQWLVVAGIAGAALRRPRIGIALGSVAVAAILRAAHQPQADAGFWRGLGPLVPAGGVLLASLRLLVPPLRPQARPAAVEQ
jgi:hypothetical protein